MNACSQPLRDATAACNSVEPAGIMRANSLFFGTHPARRCAVLLLAVCASFVAVRRVQAQVFSVLYSFKGAPDGGGPNGVIRDAKGNLYGTTLRGGVSYHGAAFRLAPNRKETILYSFLGGYGAFPNSTLIRDAKGNLYGSTYVGGFYGYGTIFKLDAKGKESVLYSFKGQQVDGAWPSGVVLGKDGKLYGTTQIGGGSSGYGIVFKLDQAGHLSILHTFTGGTDGAFPESGVIRDVAGNLYGTASTGGDLSCGGGYGCGTVFMVDASG